MALKRQIALEEAEEAEDEEDEENLELRTSSPSIFKRPDGATARPSSTRDSTGASTGSSSKSPKKPSTADSGKKSPRPKLISNYFNNDSDEYDDDIDCLDYPTNILGGNVFDTSEGPPRRKPHSATKKPRQTKKKNIPPAKKKISSPSVSSPSDPPIIVTVSKDSDVEQNRRRSISAGQQQTSMPSTDQTERPTEKFSRKGLSGPRPATHIKYSYSKGHEKTIVDWRKGDKGDNNRTTRTQDVGRVRPQDRFGAPGDRSLLTDEDLENLMRLVVCPGEGGESGRKHPPRRQTPSDPAISSSASGIVDRIIQQEVSSIFYI